MDAAIKGKTQHDLIMAKMNMKLKNHVIQNLYK